MARLVVAAAAAYVGFQIGGPEGAAAGWSIGMGIGASFAPNAKAFGPRLEDLKLTGTESGQPIPWVQGHPRIAGQIWWASDKRTVASTTTQGGKGGGGTDVTTYTYEVDVLIGLTDNQIAAVTRIWSFGKLVYTNLPASDSESLRRSQAQDLWTRLTVYTGGAGQLPDPTYEAAVGTANAPAYRNRGSVFIEGLQLDSAGQLPQLTFEVATSVDPTLTVLDLWSVGNGTAGPGYARQGAPGFGAGEYLVMVPTWNASFLTTTVSQYVMGAATAGLSVSYDVAASGGDPVLVPGVADVSALVVWRSTSAYVEIYHSPSGERVQCDFASSTIAGQRTCMCLRGTQIVFGAQSGDKKVYLHSAFGGGSPSLTSATLTKHVKRLAIGDTAVYALTDDGAEIYELNGGSLALNATIATPATGSTVMCDDDGSLWLMATAALYRRDGAAWTLVYSGLPSNLQVAADDENGPSMVNGVLYNVKPSGSVPNRIYSGYSMVVTNDPLDESIDDVVSRLCLRAGLSAGQIDVTELASITKPVRGLAVAQIGATRATLEVLKAGYFFEAVLSGDKIVFRPRGGASALTIPYADLGAAADGVDGNPEPFALRQPAELEIPAGQAVTYFNVSADYQSDTQNSDRLLTGADTVAAVSLPIVLTPSEAKGIADAWALDQMVSAATTKLCLLPSYQALEPTDVVTVVDADASTYRLRLVRKSDSGPLLEFEAVLDDASLLTSAGITSDDYSTSTSVSTPAATVLVLMDIPLLRDADDALGLYVAVRGVDTPYPGAAVFKGLDGVTYDQVLTINEQAVLGNCITALPDWTAGNVFDETSQFTVDVAVGELSSTTREQLLDAGANLLMVGAELIQFRDALLDTDGYYTLSGLLRGRRGTEWAMTGHTASERVVLLQSTGIRRLTLETNELDAERHYKGVTLGRRLSSAIDQAQTCTGVSQTPFAPVGLRASRSSGDITLSWDRRTRLATNFTGGVVPLGETTEAYEVDVYADNTYATVKRTLSSTSESVLYTSAQQTVDFGSAQSTVYVRVYQSSALVGRGYALQGSA